MRTVYTRLVHDMVMMRLSLCVSGQDFTTFLHAIPTVFLLKNAKMEVVAAFRYNGQTSGVNRLLSRAITRIISEVTS